MPMTALGRAEIVISQVGIMRRGALGQFVEAAQIDMGAGSQESAPIRSGYISVLRQPQDAARSLRMRGPDTDSGRGQRFGEMEFWALMAHAAPGVAAELLSRSRSCAGWVVREEGLAPASRRANMKALGTQALNRYLMVLGLRVRNGEIERVQKGTGPIVVRSQPGDYLVSPSKFFTEITEVLDHLEDWDWFASKGGSVFVDLRKRPVDLRVSTPRKGREGVDDGTEFRVEAFPILPPWLRPCSTAREGGRSKSNALTLKYRSLLKAASFGWDPRTGKPLPELLDELLWLVLDRRHGAPAFLRREILGRRLTRSARAVIVPRPELRIDEIGLPEDVLAKLITGLPPECAELVLVNRNPTLHRRGLVALHPRVLSDLQNVFALPLGVLSALGADFDGDQVSVVALETAEAAQEARGMLPGASGLRLDSFRRNKPAFPLLHELSCAEAELRLAKQTGDQEEWAGQHAKLLRRRVAEIGDGWQIAQSYLEEQARYERGFSPDEWRERALIEMEKIYAVREKGRKGGILRREVFMRTFSDLPSFFDSVAAVQAVTERLTQSALSVKTGHVRDSKTGHASSKNASDLFAIDDFFSQPAKHVEQLEALDSTLDDQRISCALGPRREPCGLLRWLWKPDMATLLDVIDAKPDSLSVNDPRLHWFID